jgi:hypothetical protein
MAEYDRSTLFQHRLPGAVLQPGGFVYRENAHTATSTIDIALPGYAGLTPKLTAGGSLFISSGSRPSRYYQPLGRFPFRSRSTYNGTPSGSITVTGSSSTCMRGSGRTCS